MRWLKSIVVATEPPEPNFSLEIIVSSGQACSWWNSRNGLKLPCSPSFGVLERTACRASGWWRWKWVWLSGLCVWKYPPEAEDSDGEDPGAEEPDWGEPGAEKETDPIPSAR